MTQNISLGGALHSASAAFSKVKPYIGLLFFVLLALLYSFVLLQINTLSAAPVDDNEVTTQTSSSPSLHVDPSAAKQLESLKTNSGNVQTLFEQSRTNPFQE